MKVRRPSQGITLQPTGPNGPKQHYSNVCKQVLLRELCRELRRCLREIECIVYDKVHEVVARIGFEDDEEEDQEEEEDEED